MNLQKNTILNGFLESSDGSPKEAFSAEVSPCCYMYRGYGVQLRVALANGGWTIVHDKAVQFEDCTIEHAQALAESARVRKCTGCDNPAIDDAGTHNSRAGQCEKCFLAKFSSDLEAEEKKELAKLKRKDARMKLKGFTHRVDAWIHPEQGGDDYQMSIWMVQPTAERIVEVLRKQGRAITNDYTLTEI